MRARIIQQETDLDILTDRPVEEVFMASRVKDLRLDIQHYIARDRRFLTSLKPIPVEKNAPAVVKAMSRAAYAAGVGPMAAVAGAIADSLGRELLRRQCREVIIENGGDIFISAALPRRVAIYTGKNRFWRGLCLKVRPEDTPAGICASSGTIGHSLSFGSSDCVVIVAGNAALADAVATATANRVSSARDLSGALSFARLIRGVRGVVIIIGDTLLSWGNIELAK